METAEGRIFYRWVDWNRLQRLFIDAIKSRIFYRCVDWNIFISHAKGKNPVASFTDAWIETRAGDNGRRHQSPSHLLQMRGLKPGDDPSNGSDPIVASFTDAWIETTNTQIGCFPFCRIFYRCVDWNQSFSPTFEYWMSHLLQMRGLKQQQIKEEQDKKSRIFYRCVDWNR